MLNTIPNVSRAEAKMKWNIRVFDQRTRLTEYVCEEVFHCQFHLSI